jgi:hypothetical protein
MTKYCSDNQDLMIYLEELLDLKVFYLDLKKQF